MTFLEDADKHLKKKSKISESEIENKFIAHATKRGCKAMKLVMLAGRGFPDRTVLCPNGRVFFVEFKRKNKKLSKTQIVLYRKLLELGFSFYVCDEIGQAEKYLDEVLNVDMPIL